MSFLDKINTSRSRVRKKVLGNRESKIGQGKFINQLKTRTDEATTRFKSKTPGVLSGSSNLLSSWKPGNLVSKFIPSDEGNLSKQENVDQTNFSAEKEALERTRPKNKLLKVLEKKEKNNDYSDISIV